TDPATSATVIVSKMEWLNPLDLRSVVIQAPFPRTEMSMSPVQSGSFIAVAGGTDGTNVKNDVSFFQFDAQSLSFIQASNNPLHLNAARRAAGAALFSGATDVAVFGGYSDAKSVVAVPSSEIVKTGGAFNVADGP